MCLGLIGDDCSRAWQGRWEGFPSKHTPTVSKSAKMASVRTVKDVEAERNAVKDEIKELHKRVDSFDAELKSENVPLKERLQLVPIARLNHLYDKEKKLEAERMFSLVLHLSVSLIAHSCRLHLFLLCASVLSISGSAFSGACSRKCCTSGGSSASHSWYSEVFLRPALPIQT